MVDFIHRHLGRDRTRPIHDDEMGDIIGGNIRAGMVEFLKTVKTDIERQRTMICLRHRNHIFHLVRWLIATEMNDTLISREMGQ